MRDFKATTSSPEPQRWVRLRIRLVGTAFVLLLGVAFTRAVRLQVVDRNHLRELAEEQYQRELQIPARRGEIFDQHGAPIAQSLPVDSIAIDPSAVDDAPVVSHQLARALHLDPAEVLSRLEKGHRFAWVKRQVKPDEVAAAKALGIPALTFTKEPRRFYPLRELAAPLIGLVGTDGHGLDGLEMEFEEELTGEGYRVSGLRDARGRQLVVQDPQARPEPQGASVFLTLDRQIQFVTERALEKAVRDSKGIAGMAVVMEPVTGQILALANVPTFNPNLTAGVDPSQMRNRAVVDAFEPGSTLKSFVVAAGLEEHAFTAHDIYFCENGSWDVGGFTLHDSEAHGFGWLTPPKILQVSSNIGAAKMAQVVGRDRLWSYYQRFGFGEKVGLGLPGERRGTVPYPKADVALATQAYGQGLTATAVQIATAYSALANGGSLMRPYVVSKVVDPDGVVLLENRPTEVRRVVSTQTARQVVSMLEGVVEKDGTGHRAQMDTYRVAGKTGTAQKADPVAHGYSDKRIASFVGMVPAEKPRVVILVVVDEPKTDVYGGLVAAPAFKEIAQQVLPYLGAAPSSAPLAEIATPRSSPAEVRDPAQEPLAEPPAADDSLTAAVPAGEVELPDLRGQVARTAVSLLLKASVEPHLVGSGRVVAQHPPAKARVRKGARVTLELAARP